MTMTMTMRCGEWKCRTAVKMHWQMLNVNNDNDNDIEMWRVKVQNSCEDALTDADCEQWQWQWDVESESAEQLWRCTDRCWMWTMTMTMTLRCGEWKCRTAVKMHWQMLTVNNDNDNEHCCLSRHVWVLCRAVHLIVYWVCCVELCTWLCTECVVLLSVYWVCCVELCTWLCTECVVLLSVYWVCCVALCNASITLINLPCVRTCYRMLDYGSRACLRLLQSTMIVRDISFTKMETSSKQDVHKISLSLPMLLGIGLSL